MLFGVVILTTVLIVSDVSTKLEQKAELKKAKEEGYEVYFY